MEDEIIIEELENEEIVIEESSSNEDIEVNQESIVNIGTKNYKQLDNKPSIEGVTLINNKTFEDLGAISLSNTEIEKLINLQI